MRPADQDERDKARRRLDANCVVEAGAGTGKTTLLTDRILFLLLGRERAVPISAVVALTFTEKAAGEIKLRVSERLAEIAGLLSGAALTPESRARASALIAELESVFRRTREQILERARAALEGLDAAQIGTIHSFAAHLLRLYPVEAGVAPGFTVDEGSAFDELFASEWARFLDAELGEAPARPARWLELLGLCALSELEELARELCGEKLPLEGLDAARPELAEELEALAQRAEALSDGEPKARGRILEALAAIAARLREAAWAAKSEQPELPERALPAPLVSASWPKGWSEDKEASYDQLAKLASSCSAEEEALARAALRLLLPFAREFRRGYARKGFISFDGLLRRARDLVRDRIEVRERLKRQFEALLIDEFQDTDPLQGELLLLLAEAPGRSAGRWEQSKLGAGRLFVVGDPKQSIYRFRGADIAAYQRFTEKVLADSGALSCTLSVNFRSPAGLIEPVNAVFAPAMRWLDGLQPEYSPLSAARPGLKPDSALECVAVDAPDGAKLTAELAQRVEADWIAAWIETNCGPGKPRRFKDAAILLRSSAPLPSILEALRARGIPYAVELEKRFYAAGEVVDFVNLLRVLDDPGDRIALAGLLRSPIGGLSDGSLMRLARGPGLDISAGGELGLAADEARRVRALYAALRALRAEVGRRPLAELVRLALERTPLLEASMRAYHGEQTVANLEKLARLAAQASESRGLTLKEFIARVVEDAARPRGEGESPLADEHLEAVRVMTIHKSKGLEFPVVFLANAGSGRMSSQRRASLLDWGRGLAGFRVGRAGSAALAWLESLEDERQRHESLRLLYVALTRAKERLFVLGRAAAESQSFAARLAEGGIWAGTEASVGGWTIPLTRLPGVAPAPRAAAARARARDAAPSPESLGRIWAERSRRTAELKPWTRSPSSLIGQDRCPADEGDKVPRESAAWVGRLCHAVLEGWDFAAGGELGPALARAAGALSRLSPGADWLAIEAESRALLEGFLASDAARELGEAEIVAREVPFAFSEDGQLVRGMIDLVYRREGKLFIADYKTGRYDEEGAKRFAPQEKAYRAAVERAFGEPVAGFELLYLRDAPTLSE